VRYVVGDVLSWKPQEQFDNVCIFGALHHFEDVSAVVRSVASWMKADGRIVVVEPARDWFNEKDGAIIALTRLLQSATGKWYEPAPFPADTEARAAYARACVKEYMEARDASESEQSPHDNSAYAEQMLAELRGAFTETAMKPGFAFVYRVAGGLRGSSEDQIRKLSDFLHVFDKYAVASGLMHASEFLWAGRKAAGTAQ